MMPTVLGLLLLPARVWGQGPATLQFSFSNPGARAMGFGGAFAALADDATAAFANPAGLVQLLEPEVAIEGRHFAFSTPYNRSGRISGRPTGIGIDTSFGLNEADSHFDVSALSFASVVVPVGRSSLAVFHDRLARFRSYFETQGLFSDPNGDGSSVARQYDSRTTIEVDVVGLGLAYGYRVSEALSLGVSATRFESRIDSWVEAFLPDDDTVESFFGVNHFLSERLLVDSKIEASGSSWGVSAGFLWRVAATTTLGGFYRQGPELDVGAEVRWGPAAGPGRPEGSLAEVATAKLALPDAYGLALAVRPASGRLTFAFEWDRIEYSDIVTSLNSSGDFEVGQTLDDGDELHVGAEFAVIDARPVVGLRFGVWLDPDHRLRSTSSDPFEQALFPGGKDEIHYALGAGIAFEHLQIDVGVDLSEMVDTLSVSVICSF